MKDRKLAIIGCGNLGLSILKGLLEGQTMPPAHITTTRRNTESLAHFKAQGVHVTSDNVQAVRDSDVILIAVKPYNIRSILEEIKEALDPSRHILVSAVTGVTIREIQEVVQGTLPIFRVMPNTAADVKESVTCICQENAQPPHVEVVDHLFSWIGTAIHIDEHLMEASTILGACGIAYVMRFIRAMIQGGIQIGFDTKTANAIVNQTVLGAARLLIERKAHPEHEIDKVTTPKGCTIVGLNEMEHNGFSSSLIKGIVASFEKIEKK
ncbi:MAG: pyrroline-5-carboxylate reductase [Saprospirales bacterium]|nr:pyrroline-5-carboxylate reductase [Saprospirales bacterium]